MTAARWGHYPIYRGKVGVVIEERPSQTVMVKLDDCDVPKIFIEAELEASG